MLARVSGFAVVLALSGSMASAQQQPPPMTADTSLTTAMAVFRTNLRAQKASLIGKALALPDSQAKIFWPLHRDFEVETAKLWDQRIKMIQDYVAGYDTLSDAGAAALVQRAFDWEEQRLKLNRSQFAIFSKQLPGKTVAHFFQLDGFLNRAIEIQIAGVLPEVRQVKK